VIKFRQNPLRFRGLHLAHRLANRRRDLVKLLCESKEHGYGGGDTIVKDWAEPKEGK
jgi:hypothetical protein